MDAEQLLKMPQMKAFLEQESVQQGLEMSSKHRLCHEYQSIMEQLHTTMIDAAKAIQAHDAACESPYIDPQMTITPE